MKRRIDDGALSTAQVAELFGVTQTRVRAMRRQGRIEGFMLEGGRDWRYTKESVERYAKEREARAAADGRVKAPPR
ncbi:MAG: helix-turn-helix domain-containing protein [Spirochaetota bacterium]|nr:helix-turn-helix domain-containing protein [Spirochaetota bacterium]